MQSAVGPGRLKSADADRPLKFPVILETGRTGINAGIKCAAGLSNGPINLLLAIWLQILNGKTSRGSTPACFLYLSLVSCPKRNLMGRGVFIQTLAERGMNDRLRKSRQRRDLSALGIVAKEQGLARCMLSQSRPDFRITYRYYILYCSFGTSPYARVCAGFAGDYSWSGSN